MDYNVIAFCSNLSRVYEISKCGNHPIKVVTTSNADDLILSDRDLKLICDFFGIENSEDFDMIIELCRPNAEIILSAFNNKRLETKQQIDARIDDYVLSDKPEFNCNIKGSIESILKTAINRLHLDFTAVNKILKVAKTISQMGGYSEYKIECVAEAIQYLSFTEV